MLVCPLASAFNADEERVERARIESERSQVQAAFMARERECRQRFVVTSCVDRARRDRREAMERLRLRQEVLDEAQRKQRAAQRMDDVRSKRSGEDARHQAPVVQERRARHRDGATPVAAPAAVASAASGAALRPDEEARSAEYEKRQQEAREHRAAVERRNAARAAGGKAPVKPLPVPQAASAASPVR
jgi:hypothetical protein